MFYRIITQFEQTTRSSQSHAHSRLNKKFQLFMEIAEDSLESLELELKFDKEVKHSSVGILQNCQNLSTSTS